MRRVPRFAERAQALLGDGWPAGITVTVVRFGTECDAWLQGDGSARALMRLDPYDLQSADPVKVRAELARRLRMQGRDPRYTEQSRQDDLAAAELLEPTALDKAGSRD